jgi:hypothetical protein
LQSVFAFANIKLQARDWPDQEREDSMWTKVNPGQGRGKANAEVRTTFAVRRNRSGFKNAHLVIPGWAHGDRPRCSIYSDGNRLAFALGMRGDYKVNLSGPKSRSRIVAIPQQYARAIPYGTTDISYEMDGDMIVIDLTPFMLRVAAE